MTAGGRTLVFGDDTRSFLAIVRSLGRGGIEVHAAPTDFTSPALASRYVSKVHRLPPFVGDGTNWCTKTESLLSREPFDLIIPCDERTILPFDRYRGRFAGLARVALPDAPALQILFDKEKTRDLAISCGVPVAPGRRVKPGDDADRLIAEFGLPLVLKPCQSFRLETLHSRARVEVLERGAGAAEALVEIGDVPHLVESHFPGHGAGVSVLASRGRVLQAFQHSRARERGGAGFYRVSRPLAPDLLEAVERMTAAISFTGVAMFEFRVTTPCGRWILLEVNARPWGSMPLAVALGVDFPLRWYRLLVTGQETPSIAYRTGVFGRNLIPDAHQILAEVRERKSSWPAVIRHLAVTFGDFRRLLIGREHLDVLVSDDPSPGLLELWNEANGTTSRLLQRLPGASLLQSLADRRLVRNVMARSHAAPAIVIMLCRGNICRSPVAAELLRRDLSTSRPDLIVVSAGMLPREGAQSPPAAVLAARRFGVDLTMHRSNYLADEAAEKATLVVAFDRRNIDDLRGRNPALLAKTVMLGSFLRGLHRQREIRDPDGADIATFERAYATIEAGVRGLADAIGASRAT
ncbi:MAG: ATP-grasp domain-containing protein [Acetobacteraceae bacterium]